LLDGALMTSCNTVFYLSLYQKILKTTSVLGEIAGIAGMPAAQSC
jgi:hypothetical protein